MRLELTPEGQSLIQSMMDSGDYPDVESVVEAALRVLEERECALKTLRADIDVGLKQIREGKVTVDSDEMWDQVEASASQRFNYLEKESPNV